MPQPLSRIHTNGGIDLGNYGMPPHPFQERPALAFQILQVITHFSLVEMQLMRFYAHILGGPKEIAAQMYLNMETKAEKTRALNTISNNLNGHAFQTFEKLRKQVTIAQKTRDKFAHGIWGLHSRIPDGLLWCEAKLLVTGDLPFNDLSSIFVYYQVDMVAAMTSMDDALITSFELRQLLSRGMKD